MAEIRFDITREIGVLSEGSRGWRKEINLVRWNDRKPKIDIRDWDEGRVKMGKGITLNKEELLKLKDLLDSIDLDTLEVD